MASTALPSCLLHGSSRATPTLDPTTHHTARHCCPRSHCHHRNATDSGCSSRSGRGTRPPHTPGGLWAQMNQAAVDREHSACKPLNKTVGGSQHCQCCPRLPQRGPYLVGSAVQERREKDRTKAEDPRTQGPGTYF